MEVPGGAAIAFPATGLAGAADIKVVAFKGNPFESAEDVECRDRNAAGELVDAAGLANPNCKEPLSAAGLPDTVAERPYKSYY